MCETFQHLSFTHCMRHYHCNVGIIHWVRLLLAPLALDLMCTVFLFMTYSKSNVFEAARSHSCGLNFIWSHGQFAYTGLIKQAACYILACRVILCAECSSVWALRHWGGCWWWFSCILGPLGLHVCIWIMTLLHCLDINAMTVSLYSRQRSETLIFLKKHFQQNGL